MPRKKPESEAKSSGRKSGQSGHSRARTPAQLERQTKAYEMSIDGMSHRAIADKLNVDRKTVAADIHAEATRRADEIAKRREVEKARSVSTYERVIQRAVKKSDMYDEIALTPGSKVTDRTLEAIIHARERIDKVLGIDAPTKVEIGVESLLKALDGGDGTT